MTDLKLRLYIENRPESVVTVSQDEFIVGRLAECDLCLPFSEVSRQHSRFFRDIGGEWFVEDLGSTNGTLVNHIYVRTAHPINDNDVIQVGNVMLYAILPTLEIPTLDTSDNEETTTGGRTILRSVEELQKKWIEADQKGNDNEQQEISIARLKSLVAIAKGLNLAESIQAIFDQVQQVAFREIRSIERLALLIDVHGNGDLKLLDAATRSTVPERISTADSSWISRTIYQKVFRERLAIKTVDAQQDIRFEGEKSILAKGIRGALAVPLWDQDHVVGVLYADARIRAINRKIVDDEDLSFFANLGNLVASSVQRWLLMRKLQGEEKLRAKLERYHSPSVVQQLMSDERELGGDRLQPVEAEMSILFADIVGFTALSERLTPSQISHLLNLFFEQMSQYVFFEGGTLDKFIGDCIMAFFGAPEPQRDHAERAINCAVGMLEHLDSLNKEKVWGEPLELRIAINSGKAVVGDVGSAKRVDYTVLGATVNLASRLEGICPPGECVISEVTYRQLRKSQSHFGKMGQHRFKGIDRPIQVYRTYRTP